ncbi:MAG: hypothetical protein ACLTG0_05965 [Oscillibacter sp.]
MSGRSLFPLTIEMCNRISRQFGGKMRISFAGGADYFNCDKLFAAGIWPITVATHHLEARRLQPPAPDGRKGRGYALPRIFRQRPRRDLRPCRLRAARLPPPQGNQAAPLAQKDEQVPLLDCFTAPCKGGCPIEQDIPEYLELCRKGLYGPALKLITEKNALPLYHRHHLRAPLPGQVLAQLL